MPGWVAFYRDLTSSDLWLAEKFTQGQAWVDLFANANHKPGYFLVHGNRINVDRGQIGWSQVTMAKRWKWSRGKVNRFIKALENDGNIVQVTGQYTTVLSICNYEKYQSIVDDDDTVRGTPDGTVAVQKQYTNNNDNNDNKIDNDPKKPKKRTKFVPPTMDQVIERFEVHWGCSRQQAVREGNKFWYFYDKKNWMAGSNKMTKWKSGVANWMSNVQAETSGSGVRDTTAPSEESPERTLAGLKKMVKQLKANNQPVHKDLIIQIKKLEG